jgi:hypothetical protein
MTVEPNRKKIAAGKLFGLCTSDLIQTVKGLGFVTGKRSTGYFALGSIDGTRLTNSVNLKTNCVRLTARTTTLNRTTKIGPETEDLAQTKKL